MAPHFHLIISLCLLGSACAQVVFFPFSSGDGSQGNAVDAVNALTTTSSSISSACASALNATVNCDDRLQRLAVGQYYGTLNGTQTDLCSTDCGNSLAQYHTNVINACGTTPVWEGVPNTQFGDTLWAWYNTSCQFESKSGALCSDLLLAQLASVGQLNDPVNDIPKDTLCSECMINLWKSKQIGSNYAFYDEAAAGVWKAIQTRCGVSAPTAPGPSLFNITLWNQANSSAITSSCLSGKTYTVAQDDSCQSIAKAQSVSSGSLQIINQLLPDCSNMAMGQTLCLPVTCQTTTIADGQTCASIADAFNVSMQAFIGFNPIINLDCSNLKSNGSVVCISPPLGTYTPTMIPDVVQTKTALYATKTATPPGNIGFGTTLNCGKWVLAKAGDYCQALSLSNSISLDLFFLINGGVHNPSCDNLAPGLSYCVWPTEGWNATATGSSTQTTAGTQSAPGPTPTGTTKACNTWYLAKTGDNCFLIEQSFGITMDQLLAWNPSVGTSCNGLLAGDYYCVSGPAILTGITSTARSTTTSPSTSTASKTSSTSISKTPLSSSTSKATTTAPGGSTCGQTYAVKSGDYCLAIWTQFGLTEAQFRALNPSLDAACDLNIGQVICVRSGSAATTTSTTSAASTCKKTYKVKSGDYCFAIWQQFGITEAQFRTWNPSIDAACDLNIGQVLCVSR